MEFYREAGTSPLRTVINWVIDIIVVVALACFTVYAFGNQVVVSGNSMTPLLDSDDIVLMNQLKLVWEKPGRFDVVVFQREDQKKNIKRVIGLPGETVQIKDGQVWINGEVLQEEKQTMEVDGEMVELEKKLPWQDWQKISLSWERMSIFFLGITVIPARTAVLPMWAT